MDGIAISLVSFDEEDQLKGINRLLKRDLPVRQVKGFEVDLSARRVATTTGRGGSRSGSGRPRRPGSSSGPRRSTAPRHTSSSQARSS